MDSFAYIHFLQINSNLYHISSQIQKKKGLCRGLFDVLGQETLNEVILS